MNAFIEEYALEYGYFWLRIAFGFLFLACYSPSYTNILIH